MHTKIHFQPKDGPFAKVLRNSIDDCNNAILISAFAQNSGILAIKDSISSLRNRGGKIIAIIGLDLNGTSYEALQNLNDCVDELYVYHDESSHTIFHPKMYVTYDCNHAWIAIGSNNLTHRGLFKNIESSMICELNLEDATDSKEFDTILKTVNEIVSNSNVCLKINNEILKNLLDYKYIFKEIDQTKMMTTKTIPKKQKALFGTIKIDNEKIPTDNNAHTGVMNHHPIESAIYFWFETGKMTGGSRNILDLSKTGLVISGDVESSPYKIIGKPNIMMGGVSFFGINPETTIEKDIKINYEGIDYIGNTIKIETDGKKPNKSWRIQLKGESLIDKCKISQKITFVEKIMIFQEIDADYYSLQIVDDDELDNLIKVSKLVAANGNKPTFRKYGVLYLDQNSSE